jgi:hypothetical protein
MREDPKLKQRIWLRRSKKELKQEQSTRNVCYPAIVIFYIPGTVPMKQSPAGRCSTDGQLKNTLKIGTLVDRLAPLDPAL